MAVVTIGGVGNPCQMRYIRMKREIIAMAGLTIATTIIIGRAPRWHGRGLTIGRLQGAIVVMTGGARVMHFRIDWVNRGTKGGASCVSMAGDTVVILLNHRAVIGGQLASSTGMTLCTTAGCGITMRGGMMNGARGQQEPGDVAINAG